MSPVQKRGLPLHLGPAQAVASLAQETIWFSSLALQPAYLKMGKMLGEAGWMGGRGGGAARGEQTAKEREVAQSLSSAY